MDKTGATSYKHTRFGILPRHEVVKLEVKATEKGMQLLQHEAKLSRELTSDLIKEIHKKSFADILPEDAGTFRTVQVTYSSKEAPHYSQVPALMKQLCDDIIYARTHLPDANSDTYLSLVIEVLAKFQHRFVFIHPFVDYNGRTARMFTNYLLMILNLPIIEIHIEGEADRKKYITALQKADDADYTELESIFTTALDEAVQSLEI